MDSIFVFARCWAACNPKAISTSNTSTATRRPFHTRKTLRLDRFEQSSLGWILFRFFATLLAAYGLKAFSTSITSPATGQLFTRGRRRDLTGLNSRVWDGFYFVLCALVAVCSLKLFNLDHLSGDGTAFSRAENAET